MTDRNFRPQGAFSKVNRPILARSFFERKEDYYAVELLLLRILDGKVGDIAKKPEGLLVDDALNIIEAEITDIGTINYEHICEIYLRHLPLVFKFSEDGNSLISLKPENSGEEVKPPKFLYFGTVNGVAEKVASKGLMSTRHDSIILTSSRDYAEYKARNFSNQSGDSPVLIQINAQEAYEKGTTFVVGNREDAFMTEYISRHHLEIFSLEG